MTSLNADHSAGKSLSQSPQSSSSQMIPSSVKGNLWITRQSSDCYSYDSRPLIPIQTVTLTTIEVIANPSDSIPVLAPADSELWMSWDNPTDSATIVEEFSQLEPELQHWKRQVTQVAPLAAIRQCDQQAHPTTSFTIRANPETHGNSESVRSRHHQRLRLPLEVAQPQAQSLLTYLVPPEKAKVMPQGSTLSPTRHTPFLDRLKALTQEPLPYPSSTTSQQQLQNRKSISKPIPSVLPSNRKPNPRIQPLEPPINAQPLFSLLIYRLLTGFWKRLLRQKPCQSYVR
jgi:hypothetical protein